MKLDRKPIFDAAKARGATFRTLADVNVLDRGIDQAFASVVPVDEKRLAETIRALWGPITQDQWDAIKATLDGAPLPDPTPTGVSEIGLAAEDFKAAAVKLG